MGKRSAQCTPSGRSGQSALAHVVVEPRSESASAFKEAQRHARGLDPLKRLRIATQASVLLGLTGQNGHLAQRLVEEEARGGRELALQLELWEVSSVLGLVTSSRSVAPNLVLFGRNGQSGLHALAAVEEARPPRDENVFYRGHQMANLDAREIPYERVNATNRLVLSGDLGRSGQGAAPHVEGAAGPRQDSACIPRAPKPLASVLGMRRQQRHAN